MEAVGFGAMLFWYAVGLVGSATFAQKGYEGTAGTFFGGAFLGPLHLLMAKFAPNRNDFGPFPNGRRR